VQSSGRLNISGLDSGAMTAATDAIDIHETMDTSCQVPTRDSHDGLDTMAESDPCVCVIQQDESSTL